MTNISNNWGDGMAQLVEALDSRSKLRPEVQTRQEHKNLKNVFLSKKCCADSLSV